MGLVGVISGYSSFLHHLLLPDDDIALKWQKE